MAKILVIDDERQIRELYSLELSAEGHDVEAMAFSREMLQELTAFAPDLAILDIHLVNEDGFEVLLGIRRDHPGLPVLICTAYDSYRYDRRALAAEAYIVKSYNLSELKRAVQQVLDESFPKTLVFPLDVVHEAVNGLSDGQMEA